MSTEPAAVPRTVWEKSNAVQIHVALDDIEPPIWRPLVMPIGTALADLNHFLQAPMGWTDRHLHRFEIGALHYGDTDLLNQGCSERDALAFNATEVRLREFHFFKGEGPAFAYTYNVGDHWQHTTRLEKLLALKPELKTETCIKGAPDARRPRTSADRRAKSNSCACSSLPTTSLEEQQHLNCSNGGRFDPDRFNVTKTDKAAVLSCEDEAGDGNQELQASTSLVISCRRPIAMGRATKTKTQSAEITRGQYESSSGTSN